MKSVQDCCSKAINYLTETTSLSGLGMTATRWVILKTFSSGYYLFLFKGRGWGGWWGRGQYWWPWTSLKQWVIEHPGVMYSGVFFLDDCTNTFPWSQIFSFDSWMFGLQFLISRWHSVVSLCLNVIHPLSLNSLYLYIQYLIMHLLSWHGGNIVPCSGLKSCPSLCPSDSLKLCNHRAVFLNYFNDWFSRAYFWYKQRANLPHKP